MLVPVEGVKNSAALQEISSYYPCGIAWVDRKNTFDELFALYRYVLTGLLLVALAVIACGAVARLGWRKGFISLVPSVLSLGCGLAVLAISGQAVNLFSLLARYTVNFPTGDHAGNAHHLADAGNAGIQRHPGHQQFWHCAGERYFHRLPAFAAGDAR